MQTRDSILEAARSLFLSRGYAGTRINDITEKCGISRAGFYTYFKDKAEVFAALGQNAYHDAQTVVRGWETLGAHPTLDDVKSWVGAYFAYMDVHGAFVLSSSSWSSSSDTFREGARRMEMHVAAPLGLALQARRSSPTPSTDTLGLAVLALLDRAWYFVRPEGLPVEDDDMVTTVAGMIMAILNDSLTTQSTRPAEETPRPQPPHTAPVPPHNGTTTPPRQASATVARPGGGAAMTMGDIVIDNAERFPDVAAYRLRSRVISHRQLRDRGVKLASAMAQSGLRRQDRIAVLGRNSIEYGELLAATQLSGIMMATINFRLSAPEILDALRRVTPSIIFCDDEFASTVGKLAPQLSGVRQIVCLGTSPPPGMTRLDAFIAQGVADALPFAARPDDIACLLFTSGTTGPSKCCMLGHRELRRIAFAANVEMRTGSDDRGLINMPMFHFGALAIISALHARGGTAVLQAQFDTAEALRLVTSERITLLHLAPVMLQALLDEPGAHEALGAVRTVVYSAAPMSPHTLRQALTTMPNAGFANLYGQTEAIVSGLPRELHTLDNPTAAHRLGSVGFPFPGVSIRIVDDDGLDVPAGQPGEIIVQSDSLFRGYWNDQAATLATLRDGWCHTGDIGRIDKNGLLYLVDRKKDVIISGGENVYSPEVELALRGLDEVADCAVVGTPDPRWGEAVTAVVVLRPGAQLTLDRIQHFLRDTLARYKVPRRLAIVDELPALPSGKIDKKRIRDIVAHS
ncbi:AMP-binding protein [Mycobacterium intracellulare]|nr:AMP-binding protein [Mycobacterium intracellulare]MCA2247622.1 AMP-binding protein [Mycobacterium intracellulare]